MLCLYRKLKEMSIGEWTWKVASMCYYYYYYLLLFVYFVHEFGLVERARYQQHSSLFFSPRLLFAFHVIIESLVSNSHWLYSKCSAEDLCCLSGQMRLSASFWILYIFLCPTLYVYLLNVDHLPETSSRRTLSL